MKKMLITIDGPAGAGKTTVSRALAHRLNYRHVDTGALYRAVAFEALAAGVSPDDDQALERVCEDMELTFASDGQTQRLLSGEIDITDDIRSDEISMASSLFSAKPLVRKYLLETQKKMGAEKCVVFEGRDMGTVVFPEADVKFFLTASEKARALRRFKEISSSGGQTLGQVQKDMRTRDTNDSTRSIAPLKPAKDASVIDSSDLFAADVVDIMIQMIRDKK